MALLPYALARPFLFGLDPEAAHELTIASLTHTQGSALRWAYASRPVSDPITLAGLRFPNRVGLAAGLDKNARCIDGLGAMGFGFVEVGTVTPLAQPGNPKPRLFRLPEAKALINRLGFNNDGLQSFITNVKQSALYQGRGTGCCGPNPMLLGLNIGKNAVTPIERATDDYLTCLDGVYPYADYVTVNISSPNTKNLRSLQSDEALDALLGAISERREQLAQQHGKHIPIFLKIAPDLDADQVSVIAQTLKRYGTNGSGQVNNAWGVIATNTTLSRDAVKGLAHAEETGGLSGAPVLAKSNQVVSQLRAALGKSFPIIGAGGIMSAEDAVSKIKAGADAVQIYTGLIYSGPGLVKEAAALIKTRCAS
ncbi:quinone-dependent dihydroorotate dehydrogenase [Rhodoferax fermentans]|uniref:Dihydroorotate dehydrogenase (quinone) n=1 Tax=Rhodoferax fermentans TaxID=28066 RepID=A0A1T1AN45_RHOFE|nr:quinone-dependent dihydroorotate dehydrogenase [Rhodoferax fermentans]MBK1684529.1 quinone-dependent dihydroorotate dehydrogenase [Rhodoferax fermentans]OOV05550.1 dihydroorotate dehydrogenase (quinone) [Rhodoferax fermentans]